MDLILDICWYNKSFPLPKLASSSPLSRCATSVLAIPISWFWSSTQPWLNTGNWHNILVGALPWRRIYGLLIRLSLKPMGRMGFFLLRRTLGTWKRIACFMREAIRTGASRFWQDWYRRRMLERKAKLSESQRVEVLIQWSFLEVIEKLENEDCWCEK